jgi:hypothetical protein
MFGCDVYGYPNTAGRSSSGKEGYGPSGGACKDPYAFGWVAAVFFVAFVVSHFSLHQLIHYFLWVASRVSPFVFLTQR